MTKVAIGSFGWIYIVLVLETLARVDAACMARVKAVIETFPT